MANIVFSHAYGVYRPLYLMFKSISCSSEVKLAREYIPSGGTVVDVGSNIGFFAGLMSDLVGDAGKVHCFEPSEENFKRLSRGMAKRRNVMLNKAAVADYSGELTLFESLALNTDHRTYPVEGQRHHVEHVPCVSLDEYFVESQKVDFLKIDVQGFEYHVLKGAKRVLTQNPQIKVITEFWAYSIQKAGGHPQELIGYIESLGFKSYRLSPGGKGIPFTKSEIRVDPAHYENLLICR